MSLHALTPLKAVWGHGRPPLIVVKRLFYKLDAAVEGKPVSKGQLTFRDRRI